MKITGRRSKNVIDMRESKFKQSAYARLKADALVELSLMRARAYDVTNDMKHMERSIDLSSRAQRVYDRAAEYEQGAGGPRTRRRKKR